MQAKNNYQTSKLNLRLKMLRNKLTRKIELTCNKIIKNIFSLLSVS